MSALRLFLCFPGCRSSAAAAFWVPKCPGCGGLLTEVFPSDAIPPWPHPPHWMPEGFA